MIMLCVSCHVTPSVLETPGYTVRTNIRVSEGISSRGPRTRILLFENHARKNRKKYKAEG